jgi:hypothetical protein
MVENELRWLLPTRTPSLHTALRQASNEEKQVLLIDVYFDTQGDLLFRHGGHLRARTEFATISSIPSNVTKTRQTRWELKQEQGQYTAQERYWPSYGHILEEADERLLEALQVIDLVKDGPSPYKALQMLRMSNHRSCYPLRLPGRAEAPVAFLDQITACVGQTRRTGLGEIVDLTFLEVEFNLIDSTSPARVNDLIDQLFPELSKTSTKGKVYELRQRFGLEIAS